MFICLYCSTRILELRSKLAAVFLHLFVTYCGLLTYYDKGGVCLSVCLSIFLCVLSVCLYEYLLAMKVYSKSCGQILMKFSGLIDYGFETKRLNLRTYIHENGLHGSNFGAHLPDLVVV